MEDLLVETLEFLTNEVSFSALGTRFELPYWQIAVFLGFITFLIDMVLYTFPMLNSGGRAKGAFMGVLVLPTLEELVYRLVLIGVFTVFFDSVLIAIVLSAFLFALGHTLYLGTKVLSTFIIGLVLGFAFITLGIPVTIIAHMTHNFISTVTNR